jgi:hypothetical protein
MSTSPGAPAPAAGEEGGPPAAAGRPVLDVFAVLAAMQQQLDDLREVVQAQQTTLQALLDTSTSPPDARAVGGSAGSR